MKIVSSCFNFVTTMLSYHIKFKNYVYLTGTAPKFRFWWTFSKNVLIKILQTFEKFIKNLHKTLKYSPKFFKKIQYNFKKFQQF